MDPKIPQGFLSIEDVLTAQAGTFVNVIGVVKDFLPPSQTNGNDLGSKAELIDVSRPHLPLVVKFFRPTEEAHPKIRNEGDVVLLRSFKISIWHGERTVISHKTSQWIVCPRESIPNKLLPQGSKIFGHPSTALVVQKLEESTYIFQLYKRFQPDFDTIYSDKQQAPSSSTSISSIQSLNKFRLLKDVRESKFCDVVGIVVKTYASSVDTFTVYVTDYTTNRNFFEYRDPDLPAITDSTGAEGDRFDYLGLMNQNTSKESWPGPFGQMTMQITLYSPHSDFAAQHFQAGVWVSLKNVRPKIDGRGRLEGTIWKEASRPDKVTVGLLDPKTAPGDLDHKIQEVIRRKREYDDKRAKLKRKATSGSNGSDRKKSRKQSLPSEKGVGTEKGASESGQICNLNKNVYVQENRSKPFRSVQEILDDRRLAKHIDGQLHLMPFHNLRSRTRLKVLDFYPSNLLDFCVMTGGLQDEEATDSSPTDQGWQWRFALLAEDGCKAQSSDQYGATLVVTVAGEEATSFLNLDPVNLRTNEEALVELEAKLFFLWGDLQEQKNRNLERSISRSVDANGNVFRPDNKVFECCLAEYGVPTSGSEGTEWERRWKLFDTFIELPSSTELKS